MEIVFQIFIKLHQKLNEITLKIVSQFFAFKNQNMFFVDFFVLSHLIFNIFL